MSNFNAFMKKNKIERPTTTYKATKSLCDEKGVALDWEIKPLTSNEVASIRQKCTKIVQNGNQLTTQIDQKKFEASLIAVSVVCPDLNDAELQNSYGVMNPVDLLYEMVDNPSEFAEFSTFIQKFNGFTSLNEDAELNKDVETAKN